MRQGIRPGRRRRLAGPLAAALLLALAARAGAQETSRPAPDAAAPRLLHPAAGTRLAPDGDVVLELHPGAAAPGAGLTLELDGVHDVSRALRVEADGRAVLDLPHALEPGRHTLRIVEELPDGRIVERAVFRFEVARTSRFRELGLEGDVDAALTYRVADRNLDPGGASELPHRLQWTGAGRLRGGLEGEHGLLLADAGVILDREGETSPTDRSLELADFLATGKTGPLTVRAGHHAPAPQTLILEGFQRRGVSARLAGEPGGVPAELTTFALRTEPLAGFQDGLGVRDADHRTYGGAWSVRPVDREAFRLDLGALYLRGRGDEGGSAVAGDAQVTQERLRSGTAWSVFADGAAWARRLRLRGEYAHTRFDPDGPGPDDTRRDAGWSLLGQVRPFRGLEVAGHPLDATFSAEQRQLGSDFQSIANPGAPRDQRSLDLRWRTEWAGLQTALGFYRVRDDVDDDPLQTRYRADRFDAELVYAFPWLAREPDRAPWLGAPYLALRWSRDRLKPLEHPDAPRRVAVPGVGVVKLPPPLLFDQRTRVTVVALGSSYERFGWNASHMVVRLDDAILGDDERTDSSSLDASWRFDGGAVLNARLQRDRVKALATGFQTTSWLGGFGAWLPVREQLADASLQLDVQRSRNSDSSVDRTTATLNAGLHWHALRPVNHRPGLDVSLLGTWQREEDDVRRDVTDRVQVMLQLRLVWPIRWGRAPCAGRGCR